MSKHLGIVYVEINGEQKPFRLDLNAIADLEELLGKGIGSILTEENVGFRTIRAFYWAGLRFKDRGLTVERAGDMVQKMLSEDGKSFADLMVPVQEALVASGLIKMKKADEEESESENDSKNE